MTLDLKKSEFLKGFFNLFFSGFLFTIIKKNYDLLWSKKMLIEIRLYNLMTYMVLKGMSKSLKYTWGSLMYQF